MTKYWLALTDEENWEKIQSNNIYAVKSENQYNLIKKGDRLVIYLIPKRICATFEIKSIPSQKKVRFRNKQFKYYIDIEPKLILKNPIEINNWSSGKNIPANLSIFKNTLRWGTVLMGRSIINITPSDYIYLEK
ncbi:EVE domain-containing protein [Candidatus Woesearchaeota archaeon]|nr:EVE domain-containing protein [Candidatus Woesearchaeota archaeon]